MCHKSPCKWSDKSLEFVNSGGFSFFYEEKSTTELLAIGSS